MPEKGKRGNDPLPRFVPGDKAALDADTEGREPEAAGCDARDCIGIIDANVAAVSYEARLGIALFPEKEEAGMFEAVEEFFILRRKRGRSG